MRVCHLGKYYPPAPGGIETHLQTLARAQAALGLTVNVLCLNHETTPALPERDFGVDVQRFTAAATPFHVPICPSLRHAIQSIDADIIHMQVPNPAMILHVLAAGLKKKKLVVTYQSDIVRQRVRAALFRPFERHFYKSVFENEFEGLLLPVSNL